MDHSHQRPHRATEPAAARAAGNIAFPMKDIGLFVASIHLPKRDLMGVLAPRCLAIVALSSIALMGAPVLAWADEVCVMMDSAPAANAVIDGRSSEFFVRFDRPVDHIRSTLDITRGSKLVERLHPRLESAPEVLYARAPTLPAGNYKLHWSVRTMTTGAATQGDIPFKVKDQP
jgi:methionine-rich copper-binding protein CopC